MTQSPPLAGQPQDIGPGLRRILAPNPSPMTHWGTNSYLLGDARGLAVIDPGPDDPRHMAALLQAIGNARVSHILVTHSHLDHAPLARPLAGLTGAPVLAFGGPQAGRSPVMQALVAGGLDSGGEGIDHDFAPDRTMACGQTVEGPGWQLQAIHTPGHLGNHICLAWRDTVFTGDHIMGWASSLVSPPDGDLTDFIASCRKLQLRRDSVYHPGHGAPVTDPAARLAWLIDHRRSREAQILAALGASTAGLSLAALTSTVYRDTPVHMHPAAERNVLAHLIDLAQQNRLSFSAPLSGQSHFRLGPENRQ